jgi:hypothetical protein
MIMSNFFPAIRRKVSQLGLNVSLFLLIVKLGRGTVSAVGDEELLEFDQETRTLGRSEEKDWRCRELVGMAMFSINRVALRLSFADNVITELNYCEGGACNSRMVLIILSNWDRIQYGAHLC